MSITPLPSILVLVTNQHSCERLIRAGKRLTGPEEQLRVLSIQPRKDAPASNGALEHLFTVSSEVGAEMAVYYSDAPVDTAGMYIARHPVTRIVVGCNPSGTSMFIAQLRSAFPALPITIVQSDGTLSELPAAASEEPSQQ